MISYCSLIELGSMMLDKIKHVSLLQLLWTFNGLTCRVSFQGTYSIFPNVLGHGTLFTEYLQGSVPAEPTLGNPVQWVQWHPLYQAGRIGCGDTGKVPSRTGDQWSLALFPHQTKKAGMSFWKIRAKMHKGNLRKHSGTLCSFQKSSCEWGQVAGLQLSSCVIWQ